MRLHRLEIEGFGPFKDRQFVDFDAFADDGIFLIAGRTGAGKSSVLDAVCFGLYGDIPRYDSGEKRLRSDHSTAGDISEVVVEFSTVAGRFRVTRSPEFERPAKRGGGMTKQAPRVALDQNSDGDWTGLAARAVDVARKLDEILQLSQQQFLQVILLAQNRFARFLLADSKERQSLLRRLFGTERFEDVQHRFDERRRLSEQALSARFAGVTAHLEHAEEVVVTYELAGEDSAGSGGTAERLAALDRAADRSAYRVEQVENEQQSARAAVDRAEALLRSVVADREAQEERDRARTALTALEANLPEIDAARETLARARSAEALRALRTAQSRAVAHQEAEQAKQALAQTDWDAFVREAQDWSHDAPDVRLGEIPSFGADNTGQQAAVLRMFAAELRKRSGAWEQGLAQEDALASLTAQVELATRAVQSANESLAAIDEDRTALPGLIDEAQSTRDAARRDAERLPERNAALERAVLRCAAVEEAESIREQHAHATAREAEATIAHGDAVTRLGALQKRRSAGMAGELASVLVPGDPCAVCGSTEHPKLAEHADPVTAEDIADAEAARETTASSEKAAAAERHRLAVLLAAAESAAEGRDREAAEAERTIAQEAQAESTRATDAVAAAERALDDLIAQRAGLDARRDAATQALADARQAHERAKDAVARAQEEIDRARGAFSAVQERIAAANRAVAAADAVAVAVEAQEVAAKEVHRASAELSESLEPSPFTTTSELEAALLDQAEQDALDTRIAAHKAELLKERAILFDLELRTLPEDPIDVAAAEESASDARLSWQRSVSAVSAAESVRDRLRGHIARAREESVAGAAQADEHAILDNLTNTLAGRGENTFRMNLETFVLAAELEEIVAAANLRLSDMSSGRYQLQHTDSRAARGAASGLGIVVFDAFTGQTRPAQSLSGGETFLSSLALALGLAEVVTARAGGVQLDTLFIDEGFGSLDADTLDVAMRTLDELRQGGRTVGVISHVEAMQEQIPAQLTVTATADGPSVITM